MLGVATSLDPRYFAVGLAAVIAVLVLLTFVVRSLRSNRRQRLAQVILDKNESAVRRAESVILEAESRALSKGGREEKRSFDLVNWFAIKRDLGKAGLPNFPIIIFLGAAALATAIAQFIIAAPVFPLWSVALVLYSPSYFLVRKGLLSMLIDKRRVTLLAHLVRFIESVQRAVEVGTSPDESVNEAIRETEKPLKEYLESIHELLDLGYDFVDAISLAADRMNLPEFDIFVASLAAQSNSGGSVGEVLREVVDITRSRLDLQKKIQTMTAEGRFNAMLLGFLPIGLTLYLRSAQADYFEVMWMSAPGILTFFMTLGSAVLGTLVAMKIASVKV